VSPGQTGVPLWMGGEMSQMSFMLVIRVCHLCFE
jgi:hypothetical protein